MEWDNPKSEDFENSPDFVKGSLKGVFLSMALFTGSGGPAPVSPGARIQMLTLAFSVLIITAAYTGVFFHA